MINKFTNLMQKFWAGKQESCSETNKLNPETICEISIFQPGDYVSKLVMHDYEEPRLEYGEIISTYKHHSDAYVVNGWDGHEHIWGEEGMARLSELDAFLKKMES